MKMSTGNIFALNGFASASAAEEFLFWDVILERGIQFHVDAHWMNRANNRSMGMLAAIKNLSYMEFGGQ